MQTCLVLAVIFNDSINFLIFDVKESLNYIFRIWKILVDIPGGIFP